MSISERVKQIARSLTGALTETSPFDQIIEHAEMVGDTVDALVEEIHKYAEGSQVRGETVSRLEFEADKAKQEIRRELPRSDLLMPVARSDLLSLLWNQDEIADNSQDVAELLPMLELKLRLPDRYKDSLDTLARTLELSVVEYKSLVKNASQIIKGTDTSEEKLDEVLNSIEEINELEHEADKTTRKAIKSVYDDDNLAGIEKYHLIQIALKVNNTLDHIENAGNFIRIMTSK